MSIGHPKRDEDKLQQTLRTLETKLKEKEEDILLAAQVGQSLLEEIDRLKERLVKYERMEASLSPSSKVQDISSVQYAVGKPSQNASINDPFSSTRSSPPLVQTDSASSDFDSPMQSQVATPRPVAGQSPKLLKSTFKRKALPIGTPLRQQSTNVIEDEWEPDSPTPKNNGGLSRRVIHGSLLPEMEPSFSKEIESSLMDQTRNLTNKVSELEKVNSELKNELLLVKNKYKSVKKHSDLVSNKEAQMNETLWNLEVTNQSLTEKVTDLEAFTAKSRTTISSLEKSKAVYQQKLDALKDVELQLKHENESLRLKMEQDRVRFRAELEDKRKELEYIISKAKQSSLSAVKIDETAATVDEIESSVTIVSLPSTPKRSNMTMNPFNESLTASLKQSQDVIEKLEKDLNRSRTELNEMYKKNLQYSELIDKLQEKVRGPVMCDKGCQPVKMDIHSMELSRTSQLTLTNFGADDRWTLNVHKSVQAPSILSTSQPFYEILVKKDDVCRQVNTIDCGHSVIENFESTAEKDKDTKSEAGSHSFSQYYRGAESEPSEVPFRWRTQTVDQGTSQVEALTYTMIGTWFQKYNRRNKNPRLRYFWINPYSRTLHWANQPPAQGSRKKSRSVKIQSLTWNESGYDDNRKNHPPIEVDALEIVTPTRTLRILPLNWPDRNLWISGLTVLLRRTMQDARPETFVKLDRHCVLDSQSQHDGSVVSESLGAKSTQSSPRKGHRRAMTITANDEEPSTPMTPLKKSLIRRPSHLI